MRQRFTYLLLVFLFSLSATAFAQQDSVYTRRNADQPRESWTKRLSLGGNFGLSFGNPTYINISPLIGYRITDRFIAGLGPSYIYTRARYDFGGGQRYTFTTNVLGGRTYAQYAVIENFILRGEYELLNIKYPVQVGNDVVQLSEWVSNPLLGAGYAIPFGRRSSFSVMVLYNFGYYNSDQNRLIYGGSPWVVRAGFQL